VLRFIYQTLAIITQEQIEMNYRTTEPCEELKDFVFRFWCAAWDEQIQHVQSTYFATANSLTEIAFAYEGNKLNPELLFSSVQGHTCKHGQYPAGGFFELFGVSLYSYAIPCLFNIPASALNDEFISLETLLGDEGKTLTEKMAAAVPINERISILTDYFKAKLAASRFNDKQIIKAVRQIRQCHGNINIEELSQQCCYSHKQFTRRFREHSGFNPKLFARIVRFENTLNNYHNYPALTDAAYDYGYYDQAHFIRDFKTFTGYSPKKFLEVSGY